jgi:ankyrin repeat protein
LSKSPVSRFQDAAIARLTRAIYLGETAKALTLIRPDLPLDHIARDVSHTPLIAAIENDNMAVFEALLEAGASATAPIEFGETPLHAAARRRNEAMVRALLARGADVHAALKRPNHQYGGRTPLMEAAIGRSLPIVKLLLELGADPFAKDANGWTVLSFAEVTGKRVANHLRKLMDKLPEASEASLHDAARAGLLEHVRALLDRGGAIDHRDDLGRTALHWAVMSGRVEVARLLLERGAQADARDKRGYTPLSLIQGSAETARLLIEHGADPNAEVGGWSVLLYLATFQPPEVLAPLIDAGGNLHAKAPDGRGLLDHAAANSPRARKFLKERMGVAPNAYDALQDHMKELPKLAKAPAFQAAAARLGRIFNRKPAPWRRRKGVMYFHDVSLAKHLARHFGETEAIGGAALDQASRLLTRLQDEMLTEGFVLVFTSAIPEAGRMPLILLPTADKYAALLAVGTNGINYGHDTEDVIAWLKTMEDENSFQVGGCGHDFLHGRFTAPIKGAEALAARMIEFCPDITAQAHASIRRMSREAQIRAIADDMKKTGWFGFWWD